MTDRDSADPVNNFGTIQYSRAGSDDRGREQTKKQRRPRHHYADRSDLPEIDDRPVPQKWTGEHVGHRLTDAFNVLNRTPHISGPKDLATGWPQIKRSQDDLKGWVEQDRFEELMRSAVAPTRQEMTRMEASFEWLEELRAHDAGMALQLMYWGAAMARGRRLRDLCLRKKWAYSTFHRKVSRSMAWLADRLNARGVKTF